MNSANLGECYVHSDIDLSVDATYKKLHNLNQTKAVNCDDICPAHFNNLSQLLY